MAATDAPAAWHKLDILDPETAEYPARARCGDEGIVVFKTAAGYRGVQRACGHQKMSLHDAHRQGEDLIRCRGHGFVYRLSDGRGVNCPGFQLRVYDVRLEDGALYARNTSGA